MHASTNQNETELRPMSWFLAHLSASRLAEASLKMLIPMLLGHLEQLVEGSPSAPV